MTLLETGNASLPALLREEAQATAYRTGPRPGDERPRVDGKFIAVGDQRLLVQGVTYGTFAPTPDGERFPSLDRVQEDFEAMTRAGVNAVRTYTVPPRWLLDCALEAGLWVLGGLPWEQHVAVLDERRRTRAIADRVRAMAATCAGHPALLCLAVGNEIPAGIVRWHGRGRVERFLHRLFEAVRTEDPEALVTYASYPSTEHLRMVEADIVSFNLYVEDRRSFAAYIARLQNLTDDRPLLLTELGLDSRSHGRAEQAMAIASQLAIAAEGGCAGTFVFAWTDEWHRGEDEVLDWDFGVTDRDRRPKPALDALRAAYSAPPAETAPAPFVSVVVCTHNGAATLRECLEGVAALRYPNYETIVVDDGSTDASAKIAATFGARVIRTSNHGLSAARNTGLRAARGEIVAYLDDDARPDADWLHFMSVAFRNSTHAAVGGPNVPPPDESGVAACVANSPGGPVHVLVSDTLAEHLPGCNMAFRRDLLLAVGGFDPQFRVAGDDVDVCWRLLARGETLGFHPAALVWHRRRGSVRRFWRQQRGYGRAEALLERKWPDKYNRRGHPSWGGRLYGRGLGSLPRRSRVYHGTWGTGAFQPELDGTPGTLSVLAAAPEWLLVLGALAATSALGLSWHPLLLALPLLAGALALWLAGAIRGARRARFTGRGRSLRLRTLTAFLHLLQPAARLAGRTRHGLVPWRKPLRGAFAAPLPRVAQRWFESWNALEERLRRIDGALRARGARVSYGGSADRWDLEVAAGALGGIRLVSAVEEHGRGRQLMRVRIRPRVSRVVLGALVAGATAAATAGAARNWTAMATLASAAGALALATVSECGTATAATLEALDAAGRPQLKLVDEDRP